MVLHCVDGGVRQQQQQLRGQGWCSDGQRQPREGRGAAPAGAVLEYPLGKRQAAGVFSSASSSDKGPNAGRGASCNFSGLSVEEALAWALEDADGAFDGGVLPPLEAHGACREAEEGSLEIRRDQTHLQQWRSSGSAHGLMGHGAAISENGTTGLVPCSLATSHPINQHPLPQHLHSHFLNVIATYPTANDQHRYDRVGIDEGNFHDAQSSGLPVDGSSSAKAAPSFCGGILHYQSGNQGVGLVTGAGQTGAVSPKSSISSDGSGGDLVVNSPAAVWEVDMHRGASRGGGGGATEGGRSCAGGEKRLLDAANEDIIGPWQPQIASYSSEFPASLRDTDQSMDAIKQFFLCANMELESCLTVDEPEIRSKEEKMKQLLQLLRVTSLERDEAREQLQKLRSKIQTAPLEQSPNQLHPDLLSTAQEKTDLDGICRTHAYAPYVPSPVDSLFDGVSPPDLPHKNLAIPSNATLAPLQAPPLLESADSSPPPAAELDPAAVIIDRLVQKRALPEKGKLLQAVMEAGPLLQTLLVAGPLPRWRNPPPLQPFQIPPVTVRNRESGILGQNAVSSQNNLARSSSRSLHHQNSLVAPQVYSASSLGSSRLGTFVLRGVTPATCAGSYQGPAGKRQKL